MSTIHRHITDILSPGFEDLPFSGEIGFRKTERGELMLDGVKIRFYTPGPPAPEKLVYPWGDGTAASCSYEEGDILFVEAEHIPFIRADFGNKLQLWTHNGTTFVRWE